MASVFVIGKVTVYLTAGANWATALRSGVIGILTYVFGCYLIHLLSSERYDNDYEENGSKVPCYLFWLNTIFLLIVAILAIEVLNDRRIIEIKIPLWSLLNYYWTEFVHKWMQTNHNIEGIGIFGLPYLIPYVLIPAFLLWKRKLRFPKTFGLKTSMTAVPFVIAYVFAFIFIKEFTIRNLFTLLFVIFWPALGEEFFYRGVMQKAYINTTRDPVRPPDGKSVP